MKVSTSVSLACFRPFFKKHLVLLANFVKQGKLRIDDTNISQCQIESVPSNKSIYSAMSQCGYPVPIPPESSLTSFVLKVRQSIAS